MEGFAREALARESTVISLPESVETLVFQEKSPVSESSVGGPVVEDERQTEEVVSFIAGRLCDHFDYWKRITTDRFVLRCIKGYRIPFAQPVCQFYDYREPSRSVTELHLLIQAIDQLLRKGVIVKCTPVQGQYLSSYFLVPKSNGEHRFILNLKGLNQYICTEHFKMQDLRTAVKLILQDYFLASLDLQDAYFLVSIDPPCRKYLRFIFQNTLYEFTVLPFGLCTSPYIFTKIMKPVMGYLRSNGLLSVDYLDDILLIGETYDECRKNVEVTRALLESLGFILNKKKCQFTPPQIFGV